MPCCVVVLWVLAVCFTSCININSDALLLPADPHPAKYGLTRRAAHNSGTPPLPPQSTTSESKGNSGSNQSNDSAFSRQHPPAAANRFSKFAPSTDLNDTEFRDTLKENMKADLEKRRREDPNRDNQPAKSYLDSL